LWEKQGIVRYEDLWIKTELCENRVIGGLRLVVGKWGLREKGNYG
jgi:hypothetical protein